MGTRTALYSINGKSLRLHLHSGQASAWRSDKRFIFVLAGTQGGKTSFGPWFLWREIQRWGGGDYLAVTASFDLFKMRMLPEIREVFERVLGIGRWWSGNKVLELRDPETGEFRAEQADDPMWGRIILRSAQSEGGLESATALAAWLDECGQDKFKLSDWEAVLRRLSLARGRVLGTTTIYNLGWLKTQVYDAWKAGDPDFDVIQFKSIENPAFPLDEYERAKRTLPGWKFRMFYEGEFDRPAGMIFDVFNEQLHTCDDFPIPHAWPKAVGIDPIGAVTAALWVAWNPDNKRLHVYREYYGYYGKTTNEHAQNVAELSSAERIAGWCGGSKSERQARLDWQTGGIYMDEPPVSSIESGIDRIYGLLKDNALVVHKSCKHLIDEFGSFSRKLDANDEPTEKIENENDYHCVAALRYVVLWLTEPGESVEVAYEPVMVGQGRY